MKSKRIPSILTRAMRKQYPGKIPETPFMKILGRLRGASKRLPVGTKSAGVTVIGGSIVERWVGVNLWTERLIIGTKNGQEYCLKDDPFRIQVNMRELSGKELQRAMKEIIQALKFARQNPGAGGIESFCHDYGDPPFSPFSDLPFDKKVIKEELDRLINILTEGKYQ